MLTLTKNWNEHLDSPWYLISFSEPRLMWHPSEILFVQGEASTLSLALGLEVKTSQSSVLLKPIGVIHSSNIYRKTKRSWTCLVIKWEAISIIIEWKS